MSLQRGILARFWGVALAAAVGAGAGSAEPVVLGEGKRWHPLTLEVRGPSAGETATPNPFRDYRVDVTFTHPASGERRTAAGYFAADGGAAETGADAGDRWHVRFSPPLAGEWEWRVSFRQGRDVALADSPHDGRPYRPADGATGRLIVEESDKAPPDFRARGHLEYVGERYLRFSGDGTHFLKTGVNSPETMLAYADFDGTYRDLDEARTPPAPNALIRLPALRDGLLRFEPHARDWREGDPMWRGGRGKNLIGGLNYLAGQGVNSVYFVTMNVNGDGRNVWPWIAPDRRDRFDVSKLAQWEIVFAHLTRLGIQLHLVLQETENDRLLDRGELGPERKLYLREMVARFAHHPAVTWNLGEENVQSPAQQAAQAEWLRRLNPYRQHIVLHNDHWHARNLRDTFYPLIGRAWTTDPARGGGPVGWGEEPPPLFTGASVQDFYWNDVHANIADLVRRTRQSGRPWVVTADELGGAEHGTLPDAQDALHDAPRRFGLWASLMAGGAGVEWYFGWQNNSPDSDLSAQDWRTREGMYRQARIAREFFERHLPFVRMTPANERVPAGGVWCLALAGEVYAIYFSNGGGARFDLGPHPGLYEVRWFDPRNGGEAIPGTLPWIRGPDLAWTGLPPREVERDWLCIVRRVPEPQPDRPAASSLAVADALEAGIDPAGLRHALNHWRHETGADGNERVVIMRRGRVVYQGSAAAEPSDSAAARLLGGDNGTGGSVSAAELARRAEPFLGSDSARHEAGFAVWSGSPARSVLLVPGRHEVVALIPAWEMTIVRLGNGGTEADADRGTLDGFLRRLAPAVYPWPAEQGSNPPTER